MNKTNKQELQEAYRKGYQAGHMKGTYAQSKKMNRVITHNLCPACQKKSEIISNLVDNKKR